VANFAIHRPGRPISAWDGVGDSILKGYALGKDYSQRAADKEYAEAIAAQPQVGMGIPVDTEQTDMLQEQTSWLADEPEGIPTSELETQASTQKTERLTTEAWRLWRKDMVEKAAATGDPNAVREASKLVTDTQHEGFLSNMEMASVLMASGSPEQAISYLEDANEYMPNRSTAKFRVAGDKIVGEFFDEETGLPNGIRAFTKENMPKFVENFRDPKNFAFWNWEGKQDQAKANLALTRAQTQAELGKADYYSGTGRGSGAAGGMKPKDYQKALNEKRAEIDRIRENMSMKEEGSKGWLDDQILLKDATNEYNQLVASGRTSGAAPAKRKPVPYARALEIAKGIEGTPELVAGFKRDYPGQQLPAHWAEGETALPVTFDPATDIEARTTAREEAVRWAADEAAFKKKLAWLAPNPSVPLTAEGKREALGRLQKAMQEYQNNPEAMKRLKAVYKFTLGRDAQ
jgi:hypothetical protein